MARIFITGSAQGLGRANAEHLLDAGHRVVVHVREGARRDAVRDLVARGADVVLGDLADLGETLRVAEQVNALGPMDVVIHNAGVYRGATILPVNVVAPYVLTALVRPGSRLVYVSSGMHEGGRPALTGMDWSGRRITGSYSDSKLFVTALAAEVAERRPDLFCHAVDPGWVPTRMGGPEAPDDLRLGQLTQEWLATSDAPAARTTGGYWHHQQRVDPHPAVHDRAFRLRLVDALEQATGVALP